MPPLRVAVDATPLLANRTGVGVFTAELLDQLATRDDVDVCGFALSWRGRDDLRRALPPSVRAITRPMAARPLKEAWKRLDRPPIEWWTGPIDVVHGPNFVVPPSSGAARVVTIHDLTFVRFPELCTSDTLRYPPLIRRALAAGAWVHADSAFVADEVVATFGADPERVVAVPLGGVPALEGEAGAGRALAGAERYVLAVGTVEPRKDLPGLVAAFGMLAEDDADLVLVIAGQDGWGADALATAIDRSPADVRRRIRRLGWVDDRQRADLLHGATVYAYPSVYEGFGLVPLEAMATGTPVVTTTAGALPETVGDGALLVEPRRPEALADALAKVIDDDALAADLRRRGRANLARFSWAATADGIVDVYRRARGA
jgi:glycosyltransferase involved in cell wall biosynthesis